MAFFAIKMLLFRHSMLCLHTMHTNDALPMHSTTCLHGDSSRFQNNEVAATLPKACTTSLGQSC